jgi:hypothetical protein
MAHLFFETETDHMSNSHNAFGKRVRDGVVSNIQAPNLAIFIPHKEESTQK